MRKEKSEFYIHRLHAYNLTGRRPIFGKWNMLKEFLRFLNDKNYLVLEIGKDNNYELKNDKQTFTYEDGEWHLHESIN